MYESPLPKGVGFLQFKSRGGMQEARRLVSRVACAQSNLNTSVAQTHTSSNLDVFKSHFPNGFLAPKCPSGSFYTSKNILPQFMNLHMLISKTYYAQERNEAITILFCTFQ